MMIDQVLDSLRDDYLDGMNSQLQKIKIKIKIKIK